MYTLKDKKRRKIRRFIIKKYLLALAIIVLIIFLKFIIKGLKNDLVVTNYKMGSAKINNPLKVAVITDLHSCYYGENQQDLIQAIDSDQPDLVFLVGDIIDDKIPEDNAYITLRRIAEKYPAYYVLGNHEIYTGKIEEIIQNVRSLGITVLCGDQTEIKVNDNSLIIKGISDPKIGKVAYSDELEAIQASDIDKFTFLLAHRPERHADYNQIQHDLVISGHAHGGHWRIPNIIPGIIAPNQGLFPRNTSGFYQLDHSKMLVSRGLSREKVIIPRFYNPPEVIILELTNE
jgi:predicted MPP superfamily phosphohydrolase